MVFGAIMWMISQDMKKVSNPVYELETPDNAPSRNDDVGKLVDSTKVDDKANEKMELAMNEKNNIVVEAPKGGSVNEGPVVGNDEGLVVDGRSNQYKNSNQMKVTNNFKASRKGDKDTIEDSIQKNDLLKLLEVSQNAQNPGGKAGSSSMSSEKQLDDSSEANVLLDSSIKKKVYMDDEDLEDKNGLQKATSGAGSRQAKEESSVKQTGGKSHQQKLDVEELIEPDRSGQKDMNHQ